MTGTVSTPTTLKPVKTTEKVFWKPKQEIATLNEKNIPPTFKIPSDFYSVGRNNKNKEFTIQTVPRDVIIPQMDDQDKILLESYQSPAFLKQQFQGEPISPYSSGIFPLQIPNIPNLYNTELPAVSNPLDNLNVQYILQNKPYLSNPFLHSLPSFSYEFSPLDNQPINIENSVVDPQIFSYKTPNLPNIQYSYPVIQFPYMPNNKHWDETKQILNLIEENPSKDYNKMNSYQPGNSRQQLSRPMLDALLSENIKIKRQNELKVVSKLSALKAKEQLAEMNRKTLYQKAKAADEEYIRKLNKELNLITEWKLANLSAEQAFQKLMTNKRRLSEQEREVHRVKEAENELYGELLQSQAELAIADMQLIPSIPSELALRQFLSGMNYDRPMIDISSLPVD